MDGFALCQNASELSTSPPLRELIACQTPGATVGPPMRSPVDVSYLADTVILLRYFEAMGAVMKSRASVQKTTVDLVK